MELSLTQTTLPTDCYRLVSIDRPLPRKLALRFGLATDQAKESLMKVSLGACLFNGSRLISSGYNSYRSKTGRLISPSTHAEIACISRYLATPTGRETNYRAATKTTRRFEGPTQRGGSRSDHSKTSRKDRSRFLREP